jgi:hypothetical protein
VRIAYSILTILILGGALSVDTAGAGTIRIEAWIDGTSQLLLSQNTATWHHLRWAAPGRLSFENLPTTINGVEWFPVWPDVPDAENRWCDCYSDMFLNVAPTLPMKSVELQVRVVDCRGPVTVVQQPRADNSFTLVIEFGEDEPPGASWYIIEIDTTESPVLVEPRTWGSIKGLYL